MLPQDVPTASPGLWSYLDGLEHSTPTPKRLERLYALTDWRVVLLDERIKETYQDFLTVSLFKALALPYLIPIPSERALARELAEREPLQTLCGFLPGRTPTRPTFWHFRRRYAAAYPESMLRVLIALVLSGSEPDLTLPFVTPVSQAAGAPNGHHSVVRLDVYRPPIEVWTTVPEIGLAPPIVTAGKTWTDLAREVQERETHEQRGSRKSGLASRLGLPAEVKTQLSSGQFVHFGIDRPWWLDSQTRQSDTLTMVGPSSVRPYAACNVLVIRERENQRQVLLSRRLSGYGRGAYMLPGGKLRPEESLQECTERELWEETGMRILKSRPVSLHSTRLPGKPRVLSVGVLVETGDYEGEPQHREPDQNTKWEWFDLGNLPAPLFEPARIAVAHYMNETYRGLEWGDVESQVSAAQESAKQLPLPI